jgi:hypothetical protein
MDFNPENIRGLPGQALRDGLRAPVRAFRGRAQPKDKSPIIAHTDICPIPRNRSMTVEQIAGARTSVRSNVRQYYCYQILLGLGVFNVAAD